MAVLKFDVETEKLLKTNGLKCICQLCDCGRPHKHDWCHLKLPSNIISVKKSQNNQTDYQDRFRSYENVETVKPIYPIENPRNPNPPPMDLRTENQMSFKDHGSVEKPKPCKMKQELHKLQNGKFNGRSIYEESFIPLKINPVTMTRPQTVIQHGSGEGYFDTEYRNGFYKKEKIPQNKFFEKPPEANILLYPKNNFQFPKQSLKNFIHSGEPGEKAKTTMPKETSIKLGTDEEFDYTTTKNIEFKKYDYIKPASNKRPVPILRSGGKFHGTSTTRNEYIFNEEEAKKGRGNLCSEYPSLIKISMDIPTNFKTVSNMSYNKWDPVDYKREKYLRKHDRYTPPKQKFQTETQSKVDFVNHGVIPKTYPLKSETPIRNSAKLETHSSYNVDFPNHGAIQRKIYGEQHFDNLTLPSKSFKFENDSVMRKDFRSDLPIVKTKSCKPTFNTHVQQGILESSTEYSEKFKSNAQQEQCLRC